MSPPEFVIAGAPKCGTTALCQYLSAHPEIFLSPIKEPNYFCFDAPDLRVVENLEQYQRLFSQATATQCSGEGSTSYLFSDVAIPAILDHNPKTKIIVLVRNPVEMVVSYHSQKVYSFNENETDFETAWQMSELRADGRMVSADCRSPRYLNYKAIGRLGAQLSRLKAVVPEKQLHVIVFDDLCSDPAAVYRSTLRFLGVAIVEHGDFAIVNARKEHAWPALARILMHPPSLLRHAKRTMKRSFPASSKAIGRAVYGFGQQPKQKSELSDWLRGEMIAEFKDDIDLLGRLVQRDLSHWYREVPCVDATRVARGAA